MTGCAVAAGSSAVVPVDPDRRFNPCRLVAADDDGPAGAAEPEAAPTVLSVAKRRTVDGQGYIKQRLERTTLEGW